MASCIIILHGPPASGKSAFLPKLEETFIWPVLSKDEMKERFSGALRVQDRQDSCLLGGATFSLLFFLLERLVKTDVSCIVESAFSPLHDNAHFERLQELYGVRCVQVYFTASVAVLQKRFLERIARGDRHPVHHDSEAQNVLFSDDTVERWGRLSIDGPTIDVDTTDWSRVSYQVILQQIARAVDFASLARG